MATVFYEKGKKYNCRVHDKPYFRKTATINGKRRTFYGDGEKDVNQKIQDAKTAESLGYDYDKRSSKVGATMEYWLFNVKRVDKKVKASTFNRYEGLYRNHVKDFPIAKTLLSTLDSTKLQEYITKLYECDGRSAATIHELMKIWKMFCAWCIDCGYIVRNPAVRISEPGKIGNRDNEIETFTPDERAKIIAYMNETKYDYDIIVKLAFATGLREGELLGLKWEDISPNAIHVRRSTAVVTTVDGEGNRTRKREVWDTKTANSVRTIPILSKVYDMLMEHREKQLDFFEKNKLGKTEYVFTNSSGKIVDASNLRKSYERMLKAAGVPYRRFHCIRHTFATEAIRSGVDVKDLKLLMGHSNITTTYIYVQSDEDSKRKAIEKMGNFL